jgi:hypothetical protein
VDLRAALTTVEAILEENWSGETFELELTRALTAVENARMEWNGARLKFPILSGEAMADAKDSAAEGNSLSGLSELTFGQLCRLGLALTWPLVAAALVLVGLLAALLVRR